METLTATGKITISEAMEHLKKADGWFDHEDDGLYVCADFHVPELDKQEMCLTVCFESPKEKTDMGWIDYKEHALLVGLEWAELGAY